MKTARLIAWTVLLATLALGPRKTQGAESKLEFRDFTVRTWGKADGLSDAPVTTILQARDGYLWVGTGAGLLSFDGVKFTDVGLRVPGTNGAVSVTALGEDRVGRLWVGSQQGLFCIGEGGVIHYGKVNGLLDEGITSLAIDAEGAVWIGTRHGANRWDGHHFTAFTTRDGLPDNWVSRIYAARSGAVWITTRWGMCFCADGRMSSFKFQMVGQWRSAEFLGVYEDLRRNLWAFATTYLIDLTEGKRFNYFRGQEPVSTRIWSLCESRDGTVWIGTSGRGLFGFDGTRFEPAIFSEGQGPNDVRAICEDNEGNLWLGTLDGGLARLRPQRFVLLKGEQGLPTGPATCLTFDGNRRVYVGLEWGGLFVDVNQRLEKFADPTGLVGQGSIAALCTGLDGSLWIANPGTGLCRVKDGRVLQLTTADGLTDDGVLSVCADDDGTIWAGTRNGALLQFGEVTLTTLNATDGLPGTPITSILIAREGGVWVGTENGVLLRGGLGMFQRVNIPQPLAGKAILGLYEDSGGRLWVGSVGGLACLASGRSWFWNVHDGLPNETVSGVVDDAEHNLWLVTGKGVCRIASDSVAHALAGREDLKVKLVFETAAGRKQETQFGGVRALRSADGRLWFAIAEGLLTLDPEDWGAEPPPPPVYLDAIIVNNQPLWSWSGRQNQPGQGLAVPLRMPANLQSIEIHFTALNFSAPERVQFRHKLEGYDTDWVMSGVERRVHYGHLPSGRYEFKVTAGNGDGVWNEVGARLVFIVPTPLWRAPWVLGLYGMIATGAIAGIVRLVSHRRLRNRLARLEQRQAMERERVRIAQNMHDEIGSKLTKISFMSERAKVDLKQTGPVVGQIDAIAQTSRKLLQILDETVWVVNPRNDSLEQMAMYLAQYATEYFQKTSVECELHLQSGLPYQMMSAESRHNLFLAFEEALNNVLKHSGATHVRIEIGIHCDRFQVHINDNGHGFDSETISDRASGALPVSAIAEGNGIVNMRERLANIGGRCEIESQPGVGATVNLSIPINSTKLQSS